MTDDELLTLARKATQGEHVAMDARTLSAPATCIDFAVVAGNRETARVWTEDDARYYAAANPAAIIALIERYRADADAGREFMRAAWQEFNAIRARDGAPSGVSEAWWSELTDALGKLLGNDTVPWMLGAAKELVSPYATRAEKAEAEVERLTRERDEAYKLIYVPGLWECAKCGCNLVVTEMHANTGAMRASKEPQRCPNDCGPMWRKTERKAGNELIDRLDAEITKRHAAESALAAAQKRVEVLEAAHRKIIEQQRGMWAVSPAMIARAALKESSNGDETVRPDQQGKSES